MPDRPLFEGPLRKLEHADVLDEVVHAGQHLSDRFSPEVRSALAGDWLGHPLHPLLTDLPIGFWTTSWVLDILGGRRASRAATAFVGLGVLTAAPTVASGLVEWRTQTPGRARVAAVHLVANAAATATYTASFFARMRGRRGKGVALGMVAAGLATVGGYLGGHLAFGEDSTEQDAGEAHNGHLPETSPDGVRVVQAMPLLDEELDQAPWT
jgi:uncharacterized membrane protein